jgi:regulator of sirC expression with transglutaminase-like and TPR domain
VSDHIDQTTFQAEIESAGAALSPVRANLLFAREIQYPDLRPSDYLVRLEQLAAEAGRVVPTTSNIAKRSLALASYLFDTLGFQGNREHYGDPRNSYLNDVLDRRTGIPISLSMLYVSIGERLGLPVKGVGMPGHFIVGVGDGEARLFLDSFNGGLVLSEAECAERVRMATGFAGPFNRDWLAPTLPRDIVARMLNNLRGVYIEMENWPLAIRVGICLRQLQPDEPGHVRDLGLLYYRDGALNEAVHHLNLYLALTPNAPDAEDVRTSRNLMMDHLARLN